MGKKNVSLKFDGDANGCCGFQPQWIANTTAGSRSHGLRDGYSLLELLLALALSVVVFSTIATAVQTHLVGLSKQKVMIERKQIARSVLAMMANDLRAGIQS